MKLIRTNDNETRTFYFDSYGIYIDVPANIKPLEVNVLLSSLKKENYAYICKRFNSEMMTEKDVQDLGSFIMQLDHIYSKTNIDIVFNDLVHNAILGNPIAKLLANGKARYYDSEKEI